MRILAMRGAGLASLVARFEIDLTAEPLKGAGLFAITGPTGAGKSTILDGICLALYGKYPRAAVAGREKFVDDSGEELSASDEKAILSKSAAAGFAEVDFVGLDGGSYRASWHVRRARGKADGRLQNVARSLALIDPTGGVTTLASLARDVDQRVEEVTGLTFDQFRRTVLLAQGEVDAFLRADAKLRAGLLDKITNTGHYATMSRRAHERCVAARDALRVIEARRAEIGVLAADARHTIEAEKVEAEARLAHLVAEHGHVSEAIGRHQRIAEAERRLAKAHEALDQAGVAHAAAADQRDRLKRIDLAETLKPAVERVEEARQAVVEAERDLAQATEDAAAKTTEAARCGELLVTAVKADEASEAQFASFGPLWDEAAALDQSIQVATGEVADAAKQADACRHKAAEAKAAALTLAETADARQSELVAVRGKLEDLAHLKPLVLQWPTVAADLPKRVKFVATAAGLAQSLAKAEAEQSSLKGRIAEGDAKLAKGRERIAALKAQIAERSMALKAGEGAGHEAGAADLNEVADGVRCMREAADAHAKALQRASSAAAAVAAEQGPIAACEAELATTQLRLDEAEKERRARREAFDLADAIASPNALELRSHLVAGEPCPVCGSREHHPAEEAASLVDELRARRAALDGEVAACEALITETRGELAGARARLTDAEGRGREAKAEAETAGRTYAELRETMCTGLEDPELTPPAEPEAPRLAVIAAALEERRAFLREAVKALSLLRQERDLLEAERSGLADEIDILQGEQAGWHAELAGQGQTLAVDRLARQTALERIASIDNEVRPFIEPAGVHPDDLDRDAAGALARLKRLAEQYRSLAETAQKLEAELAESAPKLAEAQARQLHCEESWQTWQSQVSERRRDLDRLKAERSLLLDGEETNAHRSRVNEARKSARLTRTTAEDAAGVARIARAEADEWVRAVTAQLSAARAKLDSSEQMLKRARDATGFTPEELGDLLGLPVDEVAALRELLQGLDRAMANAAALRDQRAGDLKAALEAGRPEMDLEALHEQARGLDAEIAEIQQKTGVLVERLAADDTNRKRAGDLERDLATAQAALKVWSEVAEAIGSADGSKFQRFAQTVTLVHLTHLANEHLKDLSPRYRLSPTPGNDLGLQIIDRDQDGATRSTASLSGGERFLASLALALALSGLEGRLSFVDTLFIDEGFGSLDADTLDVAIDALERLHGMGRKVGVISHVEAMHERIPVQIRVEKRGNGRSVVAIQGGRC